MSHFTVLVIGEPHEVENQLADFSEHIEVEEYVDGIWTDEDKQSFINFYRNPENVGDESCNNEDKSLEELYLIYGEDWDGNRTRLDEDGVWKHYTTYNPDSKWDWYQTGGRWSGMLKLKDGAEGFHGEKSWMNREEVLVENEVDQASVDDVDWNALHLTEDKIKEAYRFWEINIEGDSVKEDEDEDDFRTFYNKSFYQNRYKDKETYAKCSSSFGTFAVVKDGIWYEKGDMGWWGLSSETDDESVEWDLKFFDYFIQPLLGTGTTITVVDCHI